MCLKIVKSVFSIGQADFGLSHKIAIKFIIWKGYNLLKFVIWDISFIVGKK